MAYNVYVNGKDTTNNNSVFGKNPKIRNLVTKAAVGAQNRYKYYIF